MSGEKKINIIEIWLTGTIVHFDSFLQNIYDGVRDADKNNRSYPWNVTFHRAVEDGIALWPEQFSIKKLENKRKEFMFGRWGSIKLCG